MLDKNIFWIICFLIICGWLMGCESKANRTCGDASTQRFRQGDIVTTGLDDRRGKVMKVMCKTNYQGSGWHYSVLWPSDRHGYDWNTMYEGLLIHAE